jgi:hypothetical protein
MLQNLFHLTTALYVSGVTITHLQEHKTTVTTASGNSYTVIELNLVKNITFFLVALRPNAGHGLLILEVSKSHTTTHHSR